ncbi:hypothetical protein [Caenimonas koreensis]|uniref:hypothetical protein n=1 Tax=Caenimonas koreensis TaxID=367474 RepID=UPI003784F851
MSRDTELPARATRIQRPIPSEPFHSWRHVDGSALSYFYKLGSSYLLRFPELADFEVSPAGKCVRAWATPRTSAEVLRHLYLNQVVPLAASRRGALVLHASAINLGDGAIAFLGASGSGKSTLAASFASAGYGFLTDDGLRLEWTGSEYLAVPSHSSIRLCADSHGAITGRKHPRAAPKDKRRLTADVNLPHCDAARPLAALIMLGRRDVTEVEIQPLAARDALPQLAANAFFLSTGEPALLQAHFEHLCRAAESGMAYTLDYPRSYSCLPEVRQLVVKQFGHGASTGAKQYRHEH